MISSRAWCSASAKWVSRWMRPLGRNARSAQEPGPSPLWHFLPWRHRMSGPSDAGSGPHAARGAPPVPPRTCHVMRVDTGCETVWKPDRVAARLSCPIHPLQTGLGAGRQGHREFSEAPAGAGSEHTEQGPQPLCAPHPQGRQRGPLPFLPTVSPTCPGRQVLVGTLHVAQAPSCFTTKGGQLAPGGHGVPAQCPPAQEGLVLSGFLPTEREG